MSTPSTSSMLSSLGGRTFRRDTSEGAPVTNVELFFDLVFVFLITQLSKHLLGNLSVAGALQTALLLGMTWLTWVYTTWLTNFLDPDRVSTRLLLLGIMAASLVMAARLPDAFTDSGLTVGICYAAMHLGRATYACIVLERGTFLRRNFQRILSWCLLSSTAAIVGGLVHGHGREALWLLVLVLDLLGGAVGFYTPGLGRSLAEEWSIDGGHFAERCQLFVIIALGESIVVLGESLSDLHTFGEITGFAVALAGAALLWWVYFDRASEAASEVMEHSDNPGRLARSAYHFVHPIIIAGIIVTAAADEELLHAIHLHPHEHAEFSAVLLTAGGTMLFLLGHAIFCAVVWHRTPWTRIGAVVALAVVLAIGTLVPPLLLGLLVAGVVFVLCLLDRLYPATAPGGSSVAAPSVVAPAV